MTSPTIAHGVGVPGAIATFLVFFTYFVPSIIAAKRRHRSRTAITVLNILFGWTVVGWFVALIWALT